MTKYEDEKGTPRAEQANHGRISREEFFKGLISRVPNILTGVIGYSESDLRRSDIRTRPGAGWKGFAVTRRCFFGSEIDRSESKIGDE